VPQKILVQKEFSKQDKLSFNISSAFIVPIYDLNLFL